MIQVTPIRRSEMTTETRLPHYDDIEVDKVPGAWVLTWRLPDDNTSLRLKIRHNFSQEPDDFVAEVRYRPDEEFQPIGEFMLAACEIKDERRDDLWDGM